MTTTPDKKTTKLSKKTNHFLKYSAICGAIAPVFFAMVIIAQLVVPGYSWITQYISD
jgi:hypothetical membrane protein